MTSPLRLILFDVDGTLVDSQAHIIGAMAAAFAVLDLPAPSREQTLSIVGLSLPQAMVRLAPTQSAATQARLVAEYKTAYMDQRTLAGEAATSPLYPGIREVLTGLHAVPDYLLGMATGKSRRGLDHVVATHGLAPYFVTQQVADDHPSKPHPSMVEAALAQTGVEPEHAVMIGDTTYDMEMGRAAGVRTLGVSWGYHGQDILTPLADRIVHQVADIPAAIQTLWEG